MKKTLRDYCDEALKVDTPSQKSPHKRANEKIMVALNWLYCFGNSVPSVLDFVALTAQRGLTERLIKKGLVQKTKTKKGYPPTYITLTEIGLAKVNHYRETFLDYPYSNHPHKVNQDLILHNITTQRIILNLQKNKSIDSFLAEREYMIQPTRDEKQPDAITIKDGIKTGIEVELQQKYKSRLDEFVSKCVTSLKKDDKNKSALDYIHIYSDSDRCLHNYMLALAPKAKYKIWVKDKDGRLIQTGAAEVPEFCRGLFKFYLITDDHQLILQPDQDTFKNTANDPEHNEAQKTIAQHEEYHEDEDDPYELLKLARVFKTYTIFLRKDNDGINYYGYAEYFDKGRSETFKIGQILHTQLRYIVSNILSDVIEHRCYVIDQSEYDKMNNEILELAYERFPNNR